MTEDESKGINSGTHEARDHDRDKDRGNLFFVFIMGGEYAFYFFTD